MEPRLKNKVYTSHNLIFFIKIQRRSFPCLRCYHCKCIRWRYYVTCCGRKCAM